MNVLTHLEGECQGVPEILPERSHLRRIGSKAGVGCEKVQAESLAFGFQMVNFAGGLFVRKHGVTEVRVEDVGWRGRGVWTARNGCGGGLRRRVAEDCGGESSIRRDGCQNDEQETNRTDGTTTATRDCHLVPFRVCKAVECIRFPQPHILMY